LASALWIFHLGVVEQAVFSAVCDEGRTAVVDDERYTLRRTNGRFVRADEPCYGVRLSLRPAPEPRRP
jgi:hypothetical protein